jgi:hypothetical protein
MNDNSAWLDMMALAGRVMADLSPGWKEKEDMGTNPPWDPSQEQPEPPPPPPKPVYVEDLSGRHTIPLDVLERAVPMPSMANPMTPPPELETFPFGVVTVGAECCYCGRIRHMGKKLDGHLICDQCFEVQEEKKRKAKLASYTDEELLNMGYYNQSTRDWIRGVTPEAEATIPIPIPSGGTRVIGPWPRRRKDPGMPLVWKKRFAALHIPGKILLAIPVVLCFAPLVGLYYGFRAAREVLRRDVERLRWLHSASREHAKQQEKEKA